MEERNSTWIRSCITHPNLTKETLRLSMALRCRSNSNLRWGLRLTLLSNSITAWTWLLASRLKASERRASRTETMALLRWAAWLQPSSHKPLLRHMVNTMDLKTALSQWIQEQPWSWCPLRPTGLKALLTGELVKASNLQIKCTCDQRINENKIGFYI